MGQHNSVHHNIHPAIAQPPTPAEIAQAKANTTPACVEKRPWDECIATGETKLATKSTMDPTTGMYVTTTSPVMIYRAPERNNATEM